MGRPFVAARTFLAAAVESTGAQEPGGGYTGSVTTLTKIRLGWKYRKPLWKYRGLIRRRKELAGGAVAAAFLTTAALRSRR